MSSFGDAEARRRFGEARVARLATVSATGRPHLVPFVFALQGDTIYSAVDAKPKRSQKLRRLDNIRADPRVSVLVDHYDEDWTELWWVRADGEARVAEEGPERDRALDLLAGRYPQYVNNPPPGPAILIEVHLWTWWRGD